MIIRIIKGIYMFFMFGLFGSGIIFVLLFIYPILWIIEKTKGHDPLRMQAVFRFFFNIWLFFMGLGGLLKSLPSKGKPIEEPCIIIANHPGLFDVIFLIKEIPGLSVLVKRSLAQKLPIAPMLKMGGYVLSPDNRTISPVRSLQNAMEKLNMGLKFQLFPEGTRSPEKKLLPFNAGAFKLAEKLQLPIQPVFIKNDPPFLPRKAPWYLPPLAVSKFQLEFWDAIEPPDKKNIRNLAGEVEKKYRHKMGLL